MPEAHPIPNLFLIGAPRAGTTTLYSLLDAHPPVKEPNFFSTDIDPARFRPLFRKYLTLPSDPFFEQDPIPKTPVMFIRDEQQYRRLFKGTGGYEWRGEASTSYMYSREAAERIRRAQPDARIIAILRDPVERTYSHYKLALRDGFVKEPFREAVEKDMKSSEKGWGISELFVEQSRYYEQLKRYFDRFPRERIFIARFRDLREDPQRLLKGLSDFLNLSPPLSPPLYPENPSTKPRHPKLNHLLVRSGVRDWAGRILPERTKKAFKKRLFKTDTRDRGPSPEDRAFLEELFQEDLKKTRELTGLDLRPSLSERG